MLIVDSGTERVDEIVTEAGVDTWGLLAGLGGQKFKGTVADGIRC